MQKLSEKLWDTKQTAEYVGLTYHAVKAWRTRGKGPNYIRLNGVVRYRPSDIEEWLTTHTATGERNTD